MGYAKLALKGFTWMGISRTLIRVMGIGKIAVLARVLTPAQFGIYGIANLVLGLLEVFTETGINIFLVQEKEINKYINSAWIVSMIRGIIISIFVIALSPLIILFFRSPEAQGTIILIGIVPLIRGFINPGIIKFQKELEFKKDFLFRSSLFAFDALIAVGIGVLTRSENSLVWGMIGSAILEVLLSFVLVRPLPALKLELEKVKTVINKGKWLTGAGILNYLFHHGDDIVVAKLLGTTPLGLYQQAYRVSTLPITEAGEVFSRVTFPIYVKITEDKRRLKEAFTKVTIITMLGVSVFGLILILFPTQVISILLGENWLQAVKVLQLLAIFGILKSLANSVYPMLLALEKQKYIAIITLIGALSLGAFIFPLTQNQGIEGAAIATIISTLITIPVSFYYLQKSLISK